MAKPYKLNLILRSVVPVGMSIAVAGWCMAQNSSTSGGFRVAMSVSPFVESETNAGITFTDGKITAHTVEDVQRIFLAHGADEVYARIATTQKYRMGSGDHSMDRGLERARLAKTLGVPFNPELGLFNIYGDIRCQPSPDFTDYPQIKEPGEWTSLRLDQMVPILRSYGAAAAKQILDTGAQVRIWDVGNEVEFGMAGVAVQPLPGGCDDTAGGRGWYRPPDQVDPEIGKKTVIDLFRMPEPERIAWLEKHLWPYEAQMFAAVAAGIRSVDPGARFSTHVSGVASVLPHLSVAFYKAMNAGGFTPDELGFSYYPTSSPQPPDRLQAFKDMATTVQKALDRPVFIAEFGYPAAKMESGFVWNDAINGYPQTAEGQADFIRDLIAWGTRAGVLSGMRPWAPDLVGPGWGPMSFFQLDAKVATARPSLDAIREGHKRGLE